MEENKATVEMSSVDIHLPKYYKGYNMDFLLQKLNNNETLTETEHSIIIEAQDIYYKKYFDESYEKWKEYERSHPDECRKRIHFIRKPKGWDN